MGYQALLFCPDEKLARVVSQVFSELDFTVEPVHEPFAAVKKLMAQRYDAIVVDCENEQNASLLFKSARNSSSNQSSLALALVEGQAGVAKAYRIGANLVLTKPINVEQAKGTLRVARGLLRKNSDAASASATSAAPRVMPAKPAPVSPGSSFPPASRDAAPIAATPSAPELPEFEAPLPVAVPAATPPATPAIAASAKVEDRPVFVPAPAPQSKIAIAEAEAPLPASPAVVKNDTIKNDAPKVAAASAPAQNIASAHTSAPGSAAAPAPAKEVAAVPAKQKETENKIVESEPASSSYAASLAPVPMSSSVSAGDAPSFGGLSEEGSGGSGAGKKVLIVVLIVLALAAICYLGYERLGNSSRTPTSQPVSAPQNSTQPVPAPASSPVVAPSTSSPGPGSSATPALAKTTVAATPDKPSASAGNSPVNRIAANPEPAMKKTDSAPIRVKSNATAAKPAESEESAPALPSPPADASANNGLSGLMPASPNLPKPSPATLRVSQGVSQGLLIKRVQPKYPSSALATHAEGAVQIEATVDKQGNVTNLKVLSGQTVLARAALEAVRQWRYKPYYLNGQPVEIQTQITVNFKAN